MFIVRQGSRADGAQHGIEGGNGDLSVSASSISRDQPGIAESLAIPFGLAAGFRADEQAEAWER